MYRQLGTVIEESKESVSNVYSDLSHLNSRGSAPNPGYHKIQFKRMVMQTTGGGTNVSELSADEDQGSQMRKFDELPSFGATAYRQ